MNGNQWLERATEKIEFEPDREAVRLELADHLQDRQERYAAKGLSPEEAETAALADMGDPADIAEELGKLHRPFWGYLWALSKCLLGLAVLVSIIAVCEFWIPLPDRPGPPAAITNPESAFGSEPVLESIELSGRARRGWYTFSAYALIHELDGPEELLHIYLRSDPTFFWEPSAGYGAFMRRVVLTDSSGERYSLAKGAEGRTPWSVGGYESGVTTWLEFIIPLEEARFPDWVEVELNRNQPALRLNLQEGVLYG